MQAEPVESALMVAVPQAEALVAAWRRRFDPSAAWGVPAHVTVLYPFAHPATLDADLRARVRELLAAAEPFAFSLSAVRTFGDDVLYLAPDPDQPFRRLTGLVAMAFPDYPPYGGAFAEVIPHLTVADRAPAARMRDARAAVERGLPVACSASEVVLMAGSPTPGSWRVVDAFPLGGRASG